jgi:hypothetical protein
MAGNVVELDWSGEGSAASLLRLSCGLMDTCLQPDSAENAITAAKRQYTRKRGGVMAEY